MDELRQQPRRHPLEAALLRKLDQVETALPLRRVVRAGRGVEQGETDDPLRRLPHDLDPRRVAEGLATVLGGENVFLDDVDQEARKGYAERIRQS